MKQGGNSEKQTNIHSRGRNITIDILRLLFAVIIVLHHSRYVVGYEQSIFIGGSLAVEFFFIVSGYLMLAHIERVENAGGARPSVSSIPMGQPDQPSVVSPALSAAYSSGTSSAVSSAHSPGTTNAPAPSLGRETLHFLFRKIKGFFPELFFSLLIGFVFVAAAEHWTFHQALRHIVTGFGEYTLFKMSGIFQNGIDGVIWYLSAMLLAMSILYPLVRRFPDMMKHIGLPLITLLIFGFLCQSEGSPRDPTKWLGFVYKGLLRATAELSLGGICYMAVHSILHRLNNACLRPNRAGKILAGLAELFCYLLPVVYMYRKKPSAEDYFYIFLLFVGIMLTFLRGELSGPIPDTGIGSSRESVSRKTGTDRTREAETKTITDRSGEAGTQTVTGRRNTAAVQNAIGSFCANGSTALFLSHIYFAQHINTILPEETFSAFLRLFVYLLLAAANSLVVMALSRLWRKRTQKRREHLAHFFLRAQ